jgi:hypothetical protein
VAVQSPWVSAKNYCIGLSGTKYSGRFSDRPDGVWEGLNQPGLVPESLYEAQMSDRLVSHINKEKSSNQSLLIYPNPSDGILNVSHSGDHLKYDVLNLYGKKLSSGIVLENPGAIDLSLLGNGIYLVSFFSEGIRYTNKFIIRK